MRCNFENNSFIYNELCTIGHRTSLMEDWYIPIVYKELLGNNTGHFFAVYNSWIACLRLIYGVMAIHFESG